jgi:hypothetical protein
MGPRAFLLLYLFCLACCVGTVHLGRALAPDLVASRASEPSPVLIAVPPKPVTETDLGGSTKPDAGSESTSRTYDEATCRAYDAEFRDVCFQGLARQKALRDLLGAEITCNEIAQERFRLECLADVAELHVPTSLDEALASCSEIPRKKWHDQCYFGIALALAKDRPDLAMATCDRAPMWRDYCRHDVLGTVATENLDFVLHACGQEQGDLLTRKSCWHGIGKYIGRQDLDRAFASCQRVPEGPSGLYRQNCIHGAGWAAGERFGASGGEACSRAGPERDSCMMGVAYALKRLDAEAAVGLCRQVGQTDLREQCLGFLKR